MVCQGLDALEVSGGGEEAALGRLDGAAIEAEHGRSCHSCALGELGQKLGLANARDSVERGYARRAAVDELE